MASMRRAALEMCCTMLACLHRWSAGGEWAGRRDAPATMYTASCRAPRNSVCSKIAMSPGTMRWGSVRVQGNMSDKRTLEGRAPLRLRACRAMRAALAHQSALLQGARRSGCRRRPARPGSRRRPRCTGCWSIGPRARASPGLPPRQTRAASPGCASYPCFSMQLV